MFNALHASIFTDRLVRFARGESVPNVVCTSTAEDNNIQKRVCAETVRTVDGDASSFTSSVKSGNNLILAFLVHCDDFTRVFGRNTTHCKELSHVTEYSQQGPLLL
jgi:hypothetical protein